MKNNAIIIGAGPAGLTAAYQLLKEVANCNVTIFEETNRIGGISTTIEYNGNRIDIGGHRFFSKSKIVNDLWLELMPLQGSGAKDDLLLHNEKEFCKNGPDPESADDVMLLRRRISRIFYKRKFFDYPISIKPQTFINMGFIDTIKAGFSYIYSSLRKRPENSLEDFYINHFGKQLYSMFFEDYTEKVWGVHPSKMSASWGVQRVKGLSILNVLKDALLKTFKKNYKTNSASLIESFLYPKKGPGQLWEVMAAKIKSLGGMIELNTKVIGIDVNEHFANSVTIEREGEVEVVPCSYLFSTMNVKDLCGAMKESVPNEIKTIAKGLPYRDFITVGILAKKLNLKNQTKLRTVSNIVPDCWIYIQERDVKIGRLQIFNNWSPYMLNDFENTVWIGLEYFCNEGDEMWAMDKEKFIKFAISELVKINIIDEKDILDATQVKIKKTYPAYFGTYDEFDKVRVFLDGIENLYCIGRNGQHRYNNMDHSMLTAIEAVNLVKAGKTDKNIVWNVNTEEEYHEEK